MFVSYVYLECIVVLIYIEMDLIILYYLVVVGFLMLI